MTRVLKESMVALFWVLLMYLTLFVHGTPLSGQVPAFRYVGY
jgi:hypothetical protein